MATKIRTSTDPIDCACVIHGDRYSWDYVERLYNMLKRNIKRPIRFHVYTEPNRFVPDTMIKHSLELWPGIAGPKKSWWYKLQLFNPEHHRGPLLYFDLDCVIVRDITWIADLNPEQLWALRDFKYLQVEHLSRVNSSIMWWNTAEFEYVWQQFVATGIHRSVSQYHGDQDFIEATVNYKNRRYFPDKKFQSYRWQVADGGFNFATRQPLKPGSGANIAGDCCTIVFHGNPKPHEVTDPEIVTLWC